jgi:hypothetical protein
MSCEYRNFDGCHLYGDQVYDFAGKIQFFKESRKTTRLFIVPILKASINSLRKKNKVLEKDLRKEKLGVVGNP